MSPNAVWPSSALPASRDESRDSKYNKAALDRRETSSMWKVLLLGGIVLWQLHTLTELTTYESHLREGRDKHHEVSARLCKPARALLRLPRL